MIQRKSGSYRTMLVALFLDVVCVTSNAIDCPFEVTSQLLLKRGHKELVSLYKIFS